MDVDGKSGYRLLSRAELQRRLVAARHRRSFHRARGAFRWWVKDRRRRARLKSSASLVRHRHATAVRRRVLSVWTVSSPSSPLLPLCIYDPFARPPSRLPFVAVVSRALSFYMYIVACGSIRIRVLIRGRIH